MRIGALLREAISTESRSPQRMVEQVLDLVRLPHDPAFLRRRPWQLSGGQQRRIALARALARGRPLLILDEPTAGLDPETRESVLGLLAQLSEQLNSALLLVTHDRAAAEALHCDVHHLHNEAHTIPSVLQRHRTTGLGVEPALVARDATIVDAGGGTISPRMTFELHPREITSLRGSSGGGKTTIVRTFAGLLPLALRGPRAARFDTA